MLPTGFNHTTFRLLSSCKSITVIYISQIDHFLILEATDMVGPFSSCNNHCRLTECPKALHTASSYHHIKPLLSCGELRAFG